MATTIGVLALQGAFLEHLNLLRKASEWLGSQSSNQASNSVTHLINFIEVRNEHQLKSCDALVIPGGESTTMSLVASRGGLLEPLRDFVKSAILTFMISRVDRKPTWGTCAGLILLAEAANSTKKGGQELIGGLDVRVNRNHFGRQIESFVADLNLPFLTQIDPNDSRAFPGVFIRAPIVEKILPSVEGVQAAEANVVDTIVAPSKQAKDDNARSMMTDQVDILGVLPGRLKKAADFGAKVDSGEEEGDIIAVRQGNVFGTSFHPELTSDIRIHVWWLKQVLEADTMKLPSS